MEDWKTLAEKVVDGDVDIRDCDINNDFEDHEVEMLLKKKFVRPGDFSESRAVELINSGVLSFAERPFAEFPPWEQIRLLAGGAISDEDFRKQAQFRDFRGSDWLDLVDARPEFAAQVPWDDVRRDARPRDWMAFLGERPEFADEADWEHLCREGFVSDAFRLLKKQPQLYRRFLCKDELLAADSGFWVDLIIARPEFAEVYPVETLDEVDEVEELLLYRPELARRIPWDPDDPPVKLFVVNAAAPYRGRYDDICEIMHQSFLYRNWSTAANRADLVTEEKETFAGIFNTRSAKLMAEKFRQEAAKAKLPFSIRMEALDV